MKFTILATVAVASLVSAQALNGVPSCAQPCIKTSIVASGCALEDTACQCTTAKQTLITSGATQCVISSCSGADLAATLAAAPKLCDAFLSGSGSSSNNTTSAAPGAGGSAAPTGSTGSMGSSNSTALSTSAKPTGTGSAPRTSPSHAAAAPTLMASIGGVLGVVGGIIAML